VFGDLIIAAEKCLLLSLWKIAWLTWKGMFLHINMPRTCVPRIWHVWDKFFCFNLICFFALIYCLYSYCKEKSFCLLLPKSSGGCCLSIAKGEFLKLTIEWSPTIPFSRLLTERVIIQSNCTNSWKIIMSYG